MSQENVEIIRRLYSLTPDAAGVVRGDYENAFVDNFHPDVEIVPPSSYPDTPESGYRGPEGMLHWFQQLDEIWDDWGFEAERFLDAGDRVVAFVRVSGSAKQSGAALTISTAHVLTLRDGRVTRVDVFLDRPEALEAAGLPEAAMSQENVEIVRRPLRVRERSSRTLDGRVAVRFPRLADTFARLVGRLPPTSRLRQAVLWRAARLGLEAWNRRDLDAFQVGRLPDWEFHPARELVEAGLLEPCYRGPAGYRDFVSSWFQVWGADARIEPVELIDLGDRLVSLAAVPTRGQASGVPVTQKYAWVVTLKDGQVTHQQEYLDHAEALEAVGLQE